MGYTVKNQIKICEKKNLPWFMVRYDFYPTLCVFSIPSPRLGDRKHTTRWIKIISNHKPWEILYLFFNIVFHRTYSYSFPFDHKLLKIECRSCRRSYHFKPFCIEEDLADVDVDDGFQCRLCRINFWVYFLW